MNAPGILNTLRNRRDKRAAAASREANARRAEHQSAKAEREAAIATEHAARGARFADYLARLDTLGDEQAAELDDLLLEVGVEPEQLPADRSVLREAHALQWDIEHEADLRAADKELREYVEQLTQAIKIVEEIRGTLHRRVEQLGHPTRGAHARLRELAARRPHLFRRLPDQASCAMFEPYVGTAGPLVTGEIPRPPK